MASRPRAARLSPSRLAAAAVAMLWLLAMNLAGAAPNKAATGDAKRGGELYTARCGACHSIESNGPGPRHKGLFGRKAGTQAGFDYSPALKGSGLVWNRKLLNRWVSNPTALVPGNKMVVQLANDPRDRADILAYLETATR
jgi:cytochrome c